MSRHAGGASVTREPPTLHDVRPLVKSASHMVKSRRKRTPETRTEPLIPICIHTGNTGTSNYVYIIRGPRNGMLLTSPIRRGVNRDRLLDRRGCLSGAKAGEICGVGICIIITCMNATWYQYAKKAASGGGSACFPHPVSEDNVSPNTRESVIYPSSRTSSPASSLTGARSNPTAGRRCPAGARSPRCRSSNSGPPGYW